MKNIGIILGLVASFIMFTGCASKTTSDQVVSETPAHHDVKGEVSNVK